MDIDREVAEKVMGWKLCQCGINYDFVANPVSMYDHWQDADGIFLCYPEKFNFHPSTNITQAFKVVKVLLSIGFHFALHSSSGDKYDCSFYRVDGSHIKRMTYTNTSFNESKAICLAALKAISQSNKEEPKDAND